MSTIKRKWVSTLRFGLSVVPLVLLCCGTLHNSDDGEGGAETPDAAAGQSSSGGGSSNAGGSHSGGSHSGGSHSGVGGANAVGGTSSGGSSGQTGSSGGNGGTSTACVPNPVCSPTTPPSTGDIYADCVARINQFRTECLCMAPLLRWNEEEDCADQDAEYDSTRPPHSGFRDDICQPGAFAQDECPGWDSNTQVIDGCLQQMWDEGPPPTDPCEDQCYEDHGHFINMTNPDYTRVACGFFTTPDGKIWAVQNFR